MKKIVTLSLLSVLLVSCKWHYYTTPVLIKEEFAYKYDGKNTGIDSLININGYYIVNDYSVNERQDTIYANNNMIFFKDGTFAQDRYSYVSNYSKDTFNFFEHTSPNNHSNGFYEGGAWGRYLISGDTIKIQYVVRPLLYSSDPSWDAMEIWYKVIDRSTLQEIFSRPIGISENEKEHYYELKKNRHVTPLPCIFINAEILPHSNGWIKRQRWFWKDEEEWRKYMGNSEN